MTIALSSSIPYAVSSQLLEHVSDHASAVDQQHLSASYALPLLAGEGALSLGLATNADGALVEQVRVIRALAERDLSVAFSSWAHRMVAEYISVAESPTPYLDGLAEDIAHATRPGVSGIASVMKTAAGYGNLDLQAVAVEGGYRVSGRIPWASNLSEDSIIVTGAATDDGIIIFAFEAHAPGVELLASFELLGLNATASSGVILRDAFIPTDAIISRDLAGFTRRVRPTFTLLQVSECLGLAHASIAAAASRLNGVHATFANEHKTAAQRISELIDIQERLAERVGQETIAPVELLRLRLDAATSATNATGIELRVSGGAGYAKNSPASRRFREAAFIPVQSPSEAQLRWELERVRGRQ